MLLRAKPPKGGDAEPRGYRERFSSCSPGRQRYGFRRLVSSVTEAGERVAGASTPQPKVTLPDATRGFSTGSPSAEWK
jgi:hypothetical protein